MTGDKDKVAAKPCPVCGRPADPRARPFCSARCADIDLHRWLGGVYRIEEAADEAVPLLDDDED